MNCFKPECSFELFVKAVERLRCKNPVRAYTPLTGECFVEIAKGLKKEETKMENETLIKMFLELSQIVPPGVKTQRELALEYLLEESEKQNKNWSHFYRDIKDIPEVKRIVEAYDQYQGIKESGGCCGGCKKKNKCPGCSSELEEEHLEKGVCPHCSTKFVLIAGKIIQSGEIELITK